MYARQDEKQQKAETATQAERTKRRDEDHKQRPRFEPTADETPHICRGID